MYLNVDTMYIGLSFIFRGLTRDYSLCIILAVLSVSVVLGDNGAHSLSINAITMSVVRYYLCHDLICSAFYCLAPIKRTTVISNLLM